MTDLQIITLSIIGLVGVGVLNALYTIPPLELMFGILCMLAWVNGARLE